MKIRKELKIMNYKELEEINRELRKTDVKGKDYVEVNERIKAFRRIYPEGIIDTRLLSNENGVCVFMAQVGYYDEEGVKWLASGHAYEKENSSFINKTSYIENCETSAVGRALGNLGIGIDTSIASAEEVENAILQQETQQTINSSMEKALRQAIIDNEIDNAVVTTELKKLGHTKLSELLLIELMNFKRAIGVE
jgi:hypothetical protein